MGEPFFTPAEAQEIEALLVHAATPRSACGDVLRALQRHRRWIDDDTLAAVAARLQMSPAEAEAVATFYNFIYRRPVGRHVILVCDSISCWVMGAGALTRKLSDILGVAPGETTADGEFTLLPAACLGACDHAPVMMIDEQLFLDLQPDQVAEIVAAFRSPTP